MAWQVLIKNGGILNFTSILAFDVKDEAKAVSTPIEKGSFASYNKVHSPAIIHVSLGVANHEFSFDNTFAQVKELQEGIDLVSLVTPQTVYEPFTVTSFSYRMDSSRVLTLDLTLEEINEVESRISEGTIKQSTAKNPTSSSTANTGKTQTVNTESTTSTAGKGKYNSIISKIDGIFGGD